MLFKKNLIMNDIVIQIIKNLIQSTLVNVLMSKILPFVSNLLHFSGPYHLIFIYLLIAIAILFILYKIFIYFKSNKFTSEKKSSNSKISSILSNSNDFDLDPRKMEKMKNKKNKKNKSSKSSKSSKKILTTDLLSSY